MIFQAEERKTQGSLFAFIDLLFLLVAFLVLVLFFIQMKKSSAEVDLERVQQELSVIEKKKSAIEETLTHLKPILEQFSLQKKREIEKRRAESARQVRRRRRSTIRLKYNILADGSIQYENQIYSLERFKREVVATKRKSNWISFRALAGPKTPFGTVIKFRGELLKDSNEFDTYWDNLK